MRYLLALVMLLLAFVPAHAKWLEATSQNFIVYSDGDGAELQTYTKRLENFHRVLTLMTGLGQASSPNKLKVYLVKNESDIRQAWVNIDYNVVGFYSTQPRGAIAVVARAKSINKFALEGETILYHEYVHHFMFQFAPTAYPAWYREGLAEYFATIEFNPDGTIDIGRGAAHRLPALSLADWISIDKLMDGDSSRFTDMQTELLYAQGWLLTHYMVSDSNRNAQLSKYLHARAQGKSHGEAFQTYFGISSTALGEALKQYYRTKKIPMRRLRDFAISDSLVTVRPLTEAQDKSVFAILRADFGVPKHVVATTISKLKSLASEAPDEPGIARALGEFHCSADKTEDGIAMLKTLTQKMPAYQAGWTALASCYLNQPAKEPAARLAQDKLARKAASAGNKLNPDDPLALVQFYRSFRAEPAGPSAMAVQALEISNGLLPQYVPTAMLLAREKGKAGDFDSAVGLLKPIAYSPHGGKLAERARGWIASLQAKKVDPLPTDFLPDDE